MNEWRRPPGGERRDKLPEVCHSNGSVAMVMVLDYGFSLRFLNKGEKFQRSRKIGKRILNPLFGSGKEIPPGAGTPGAAKKMRMKTVGLFI